MSFLIISFFCFFSFAQDTETSEKGAIPYSPFSLQIALKTSDYEIEIAEAHEYRFHLVQPGDLAYFPKIQAYFKAINETQLSIVLRQPIYLWVYHKNSVKKVKYESLTFEGTPEMIRKILLLQDSFLFADRPIVNDDIEEFVSTMKISGLTEEMEWYYRQTIPSGILHIEKFNLTLDFTQFLAENLPPKVQTFSVSAIPLLSFRPMEEPWLQTIPISSIEWDRILIGTEPWLNSYLAAGISLIDRFKSAPHYSWLNRTNPRVVKSRMEAMKHTGTPPDNLVFFPLRCSKLF